jgi:hypothetical protein
MGERVEYYGATWCKVCIEIKPALSKLCADLGIPFVEYDIDELEGDERVVDIKKVPTVRIYQKDAKIDEITTNHVNSIKTALSKFKTVVLTDDF